MARVLDIYLHNFLAGKLLQDNLGDLSFQYTESYINNENAWPISVSMPVCSGIYKGILVKAFFSGFLPEDVMRHRLAQYLGVSEKNPFSLLEIIGGECAGAIALYPEGQIPPNGQEADIEILDNKDLSRILQLLKKQPLLAGMKNIRLSLAGAQDKLPVGIKDGKIALIKGTTPTTHILKPMIEGVQDSVQNELFCMRLAKLLDIDVPEVEMGWGQDLPYFLVKRYDRMLDESGKIIRLHQEDFCQALGIMPENKYEHEGGPNIAKCLEVLQKYSLQPAADHLTFIKIVIFNYLIGNADAHGKNFSLLYREKSSVPILAPTYDLLSTVAVPKLSSRMAMKIGGEYEPEKVFLRHWHRLVPDTTIARKNLEKQLQKVAKDIVEKAMLLKDMLSKEGIVSDVFDTINAVIHSRAERIKSILIK